MVTGAPGVGKTTLIRRIHEHFTSQGLRVTGITTREVREGAQRVGFRLTDISSGSEGWLARIGRSSGPRIGRYIVDSEDLEMLGVQAVQKSADEIADLVLVDEIGPMEMTSNNFRKAIADLLSRDRIVVATIKQGSHYPEVEHASKSSEVIMVELSRENRNEAFQRITSIIDSWTTNRR